MKDYYIPTIVVGAVAEKRAKDPRTGKRKPPLYAAYIELVIAGLHRFLSDTETETAVLSNWIRVDTTDTDCWQRVRLPIPDEIHTAVKAAAQTYDRGLYEFVHGIIIEAVKEFDFSKLQKQKQIDAK